MELLLNLFWYFIYVIVCLACLKIIRKVTKQQINITSVFVLPYLIICSLQELICLSFDSFALPSFDYWLINSLFVLATCITEVLLVKLENKSTREDVFENFYKDYHSSKCFLCIAALFVIITAIISIMMVNTVELSLILQDEFQDEFNNTAGGSFYSRLLTLIFAVYFLGINRTKLGYVFGALCFVPNIIVNTKGILFLPVIAALLSCMLLGRIHNIKKTIFTLGCIGIFIFFFSYLIEDFIYDNNPFSNSDRFVFLFEKLIVYVLSGVQEFFVNLRDGIIHSSSKVNITLVSLNNLLAKFGLSESASSINEEFYRYIGTLPNYGRAYSNVNGYIGTLYLFNGLFGGLLIHIFWIVTTFLIKIKAYKCKRIFWIILYSLFLSGFFLGWFDFYFMQTFWLYFIILTFVVDKINILFTKYHVRI